MLVRDHKREALRWAKFPATILFITGFVWMLNSFFEFDQGALYNQTKTGLGAFMVLLNLVFVPMACFLGGLGILYVKRWAIWLSGITPLIPWVQVLIDKFSRIDQKFSAYRNGGTMDDFQSGVMTALAVIAVTGIYVMVIVHLRRSYRHLFMSEQWIRGNLLPETKGRRNLSIETAKSDVEAGDFCMMMPDMDADEPA
ncbi:MAG: hypothetical protein H7A35_07645 [Planctomycetales bacterium]|nr:hypothetical protein [bacterium]UNM09925.1 MAG: hypothetical protein H7A35_07645 [Planctomycetales bacterium]